MNPQDIMAWATQASDSAKVQITQDEEMRDRWVKWGWEVFELTPSIYHPPAAFDGRKTLSDSELEVAARLGLT